MTASVWETDLDRANRLLAEWPLIAKSIARQCKWRPQGQCFYQCLGIAVCNLTGLLLVDAQGNLLRPAIPPEEPC